MKMLFFNNPRHKSRSRSAARKSRRRQSRRVAHHSKGASMARRSRRRHTRINPRGRRARRNPHRRRYRRNPIGISAGGVVSTIKQGVKGGAVILVSQVATRKALNLVTPHIPIGGIPGTAIAGLGVPVAITIIARKAIPKHAALISAAAFAEGLRDILAATPIGPYLGDVSLADAGPVDFGAYPPAQIPAGMGAYPGGGLGDDVMVQ